MSKILKEDIEAFLTELTESKKALERKFRLVSGCKTYGLIDLDLPNICSDPECTTCRNFENAFRKEVENWKVKETKIDLNNM